MDDPSPTVSVVVPTHGRAAKLGRLLQALAAQTLGRERFEVLVVDDASPDETPRVLAEWASSGRLALRVFRQERNRGPAAARNVGWRAASASLVAFTDDDCEPEPAWLEAGLAKMTGDVALVMGRTRADPTSPFLDRPFARSVVLEDENPGYPTCNVFYRRTVLVAADGFDETFRLPCGEDMDLAWRVKKAGHASAFAADAVVVHEVDPPDFGRFLRDRYRWSEHVHVLQRHPDLRRFYYRRWFFRRSHVHALATVLTVLVAAATNWLLLGWLPLLWFERLRGSDARPAAAGRARVLAGRVVGDLWELAAFTAASLRYRTLLL